VGVDVISGAGLEALPSTVTFPPVGTCIYCGTKDGEMTDEHIVPFGLGGNVILPKASCRNCAKRTGQMEQTIQRMILGPFRVRFGLPTRRKKERPAELELQITKGGKITKRNVPISAFPLVYHTIRLPRPRILDGLPPTDKLDCESVVIVSEADQKRYAGRHGEGFSPGQFEPIIFYRFLAKIAHSFAVSRLGFGQFRPFLRDIVLGKPDVPINSLFQLIGGGADVPIQTDSNPELRQGHILQNHSHKATGVDYALVSIRLFSFLGTPTYYAVVGEHRRS
jgi:hypothetical protein